MSAALTRLNGTRLLGTRLLGTRLQSGRAVTWRTIAGIVLVPLVAAGVLLWGLWNPTERLDTVTAAVVNLDEPVTVDGQTVPMGRLLAAELIGEQGGDADDDAGSDTNFTWLLTDEDDAAAGLDEGRYATVVTIPENFSKAATSASDGADAVERATVDVRTSDRGRLLDPALSNIVTTTATSLLNEQLGTQFVGNIFVGMNELGAGIGDAADGASQLAEGGSSLANGADELATGMSGLAEGTAQLSAGVGELSAGTSQLAAGASALAQGADQAAAGGQELATQTKDYAAWASASIASFQGDVAQSIAPLQHYRDLIKSGVIPMTPEDQADEVLRLNELIDSLSAASTDGPSNELTQIKYGGAALAAGAQQSADGQKQLASGVRQTSDGVVQLSSGVGQLAAQTPELAAGAGEIAGGTAGLAEGARKAADGTAGLAEGLEEAANGVPQYTAAQRDKMAAAMVKPVEATGAGDELFNASGVPLFAGIALWAGALAAFLVLAPLWRRTREAARGVGFITLRSALPAIALGAVQGALAGVILPILLGYDLAQGLGFLSLALVAGISFSLVNQGLSALLGGFGRFISFALLVVAFAIGVISTAPPILQAIGDASPIGALFGGFQAIAMSVDGGGAAIWALILWGLGGLALTAFAVARQRKRIAPAN